MDIFQLFQWLGQSVSYQLETSNEDLGEILGNSCFPPSGSLFWSLLLTFPIALMSLTCVQLNFLCPFSTTYEIVWIDAAFIFLLTLPLA